MVSCLGDWMNETGSIAKSAGTGVDKDSRNYLRRAGQVLNYRLCQSGGTAQPHPHRGSCFDYRYVELRIICNRQKLSPSY